MSIPVNPPELIISLSRDKVRLHLLDQPESGRAAWKASFPVEGVFIEDQISGALDFALNQNPSLIDHFDDVAILVVDMPNVCIPQFYTENGRLTEIAGRYLRIRAGDTLSTDATSGDIAIAYSLPRVTIAVLREYYANAGHMHLASVLWNAISQLIVPGTKENSRLFFFSTENTLFVIGESAGKLTFSKSFYIREQGDLSYYAIACSTMLRPKENWLLTIKDEDSAFFEIGFDPYFKIHHQLELPELHTLIARHRSCAS